MRRKHPIVVVSCRDQSRRIFGVRLNIVNRRIYKPGLESNSCRIPAGERRICWAVFAAPNARRVLSVVSRLAGRRSDIRRRLHCRASSRPASPGRRSRRPSGGSHQRSHGEKSHPNRRCGTELPGGNGDRQLSSSHGPNFYQRLPSAVSQGLLHLRHDAIVCRHDFADGGPVLRCAVQEHAAPRRVHLHRSRGDSPRKLYGFERQFSCQQHRLRVLPS